MPSLNLKNGSSIELMDNDLPVQYDYEGAIQACNDLGKGWRLPSIIELEEIYDLKDMYNFADYGFWGYWSADESSPNNAYYLCGPDGSKLESKKEEKNYVRPVRDIKMDEMIGAIVNNFCNSNSYRMYLIDKYNSIEQLFRSNALNMLIENYNGKSLKIIFGEATQNLDNFIYGNNANMLAKNSFLKPAIILDKKCGKKSGFQAKELHQNLEENGVIAIDMFPLPLPSEVYRNGYEVHRETQDAYLNLKLLNVLEIVNTKQIIEVRCICRYQNVIVRNEANRFIELLNQVNLNLRINFNEGNLSNAAGGLDKTKYNNFVGIN
jgi:hypothetical protein